MLGYEGRRRRPPEETAYVLDPKAVYGDDFPGETFRVLKENERKKYGEYRTERLVLEYYRAWHRREMSAFDEWLSSRADHRDLDQGKRPERNPEGRNERPTDTADWWHQQRRGRPISNLIRRA